MQEIHGYAAVSRGRPLEEFCYTVESLGDEEVEVKVSNCGLCRSDISLIYDEWNVSIFPFIPGHEIVGIVTGIGTCVTTPAVGQRVGIGWQCGSCGNCRFCRTGQESVCTAKRGTCVGRHGGFAEFVRVDARFAVPVPEELSSMAAAPLMCAGSTVYSAVRGYGLGPHSRIGVIGVGGLGHLAIQFAKAFGCEVVALSRSPEKASDARRAGADFFVDISSVKSLNQIHRSLDLLLCTAPGSLPWDVYLRLLLPRGCLCLIGVPNEPVTFSALDLIGIELTVSGGAVASPAVVREMLEVAARTRIAPAIELLPIAEVNKGIERLLSGQVRYRIVFEN